jgi:hypothetical protein
VRTVSFHPFPTSSAEIDKIVGSRGSCEAVKRIREDEFVGLHEVNIYLFSLL